MNLKIYIKMRGAVEIIICIAFTCATRYADFRQVSQFGLMRL